MQQLEVAPTDVLAVIVGLAAASLDIASGHQNYTFNNLIACLICCDILQVSPLLAVASHVSVEVVHAICSVQNLR